MNDINISVSSTETYGSKLKFKKKHKIIAVANRHPVNSVTHINVKLIQITRMLDLHKSEFYIVGDINVDLLQTQTKSMIKNNDNNLIANSKYCLISKPILE